MVEAGRMRVIDVVPEVASVAAQREPPVEEGEDEEEERVR